MADSLFPLVQKVLASGGSPPVGPMVGAPYSNFNASTATANITANALNADKPFDAASLLTTLFSFSSSIKLIFLGGLFDLARRWSNFLYAKFVGFFFIVARFHEQDPSYDWIIVWLSKQPGWRDQRDVTVEVSWSGHGGHDSSSATLEGEEDLSSMGSYRAGRKLTYVPSPSTTYSLWYKGKWLTVTRIQEEQPAYSGCPPMSTIHISIFSRDGSILLDLLAEARKLYIDSNVDSMCVFVAENQTNDWKLAAQRERRSIDSIVLDPGMKELLLEDAQDFLRSKDWYKERGIPFRRGYLLYGEPGTGKTSIIHSIAGELGLDVYIVTLSKSGMDDSVLNELLNNLPSRCIALMEDIDAALTTGINRDDSGDSDSGDSDSTKTQEAKSPPTGTTAASSSVTTRLSLSGLLNAIDGVGAQEGRILFATTNKYSSLDSALCRPGRMDLHVEFKLTSHYQAEMLFNRFYLPSNGKDDKEKETQPEEQSIPEKKVANTEASADTAAAGLCEKASIHGTVHTGKINTSNARINELAKEFAQSIPDRECSMAGLQGYLMGYKIRPEQAVVDVKDWVVKEREAREKRTKKEKEKATKGKEDKDKEEKEKKEKEEKEGEGKKAESVIGLPKEVEQLIIKNLIIQTTSDAAISNLKLVVAGLPSEGIKS